MTTTVILLRHARTSVESYPEDALRPIITEGREMQRKMNHRLLNEGYSPDVIFCSPLLRTKQTAEVISETFSIPWREESALGTKFDVEYLLSLIPHSRYHQIVFFIGHEPSLVEFARYLTGRQCLPMGLSHSSAAVIQFESEIAFGEGFFVDYIQP